MALVWLITKKDHYWDYMYTYMSIPYDKDVFWVRERGSYKLVHIWTRYPICADYIHLRHTHWLSPNIRRKGLTGWGGGVVGVHIIVIKNVSDFCAITVTMHAVCIACTCTETVSKCRSVPSFLLTVWLANSKSTKRQPLLQPICKKGMSIILL